MEPERTLGLIAERDRSETVHGEQHGGVRGGEAARRARPRVDPRERRRSSVRSYRVRDGGVGSRPTWARSVPGGPRGRLPRWWHACGVRSGRRWPASGGREQAGGRHDQVVIASAVRARARRAPPSGSRASAASGRGAAVLGGLGSLGAGRAMFHSYSAGNCMLIALQCHERGIVPERVAGFRTWLKLGPVRLQERDGAEDPRPGHRQGARRAGRGNRRAARVLQDRVRIRALADRALARGRAGVTRAVRGLYDSRRLISPKSDSSER